MAVRKTAAKKASTKKKATVETKKTVKENKGGRPTDFKPEYCDQVTKLCRLGATDVDIAEFFDVVVATVQNWKRTHPEFLDSIKEGKVNADIEVANSLFKKATGYTTEVEKIVGSGDNKRVEKVKVAVEPETQAAVFWLKNRRKEEWRDKQDIDLTDTRQTDEQIKARLAAIVAKSKDEEESDGPSVH